MPDLKTVFAGAIGLNGGKRTSRGKNIPRALPVDQFMFTNQFARWDMSKALKNGYEINEWVYACVNAIARHAAQVPWRVSEFESAKAKQFFYHEMKGIPPAERNHFYKDAHKIAKRFVGYEGKQPLYERKSHLLRLPDDPLEQLLEQPNTYNTRRTYIELISQHKLIGGEAMLVKIRSKVIGIPGYKTPIALYPLYPQAVEVDHDGQIPTMYRYGAEGFGGEAEQKYVPADVIHFKYANPTNPVRGISPLASAAQSVQIDNQAATFQLNSMGNRGLADVMLSTGETLGKKDFQQARAMFRANRTEPGSERAPWFMGTKVEVARLMPTAAEVDYIKTRGMSRQGVCSIYGVYPPVIAVMEGFGVTAIDAILRHHWIQTVIPFLDDIMEDLQAFLVPEFPGDRLCWYDTSNVQALSENLMERMRTAKIPWSMAIPAATINDRLDLGYDLDDVVGADEGFLPAGAVMARDIVEGNIDNSESGNTNTPPDGGDPGEPGDDVDPNEPEPEDDPAGEAKMAYLTNGHSDPHEGVKRWTAEEVLDWAGDKGVEITDLGQKLGDHFEFFVEEMPVEFRAASYDPDFGLQVEEAASGGWYVRFYHGAYTQEKRDRLLDRMKRWGYAV